MTVTGRPSLWPCVGVDLGHDQGWGRLQKPDYDYSAHKIIDYDYRGD